MSANSLMDDASRVLELVNVQPRPALAQAADLVRRARLARDHAAASVAARAAGLAAMHLTNLDTAAEFLQAAVASARRSGSAGLTGEARMSLAFAETRRGHVRRALRTIDAALTDLGGLQRARALAQRGAIRQQIGHLDEALADYRAALPALRRHADWTWVQRLHSNRGVLFIYRSQLVAAEAELAEAERVCRRHGLDLQLAFVYDNVSFLHIRRGDVPAALHWLDVTEKQHSALGAQAGAVLMDRGELLLSVGLIAEARTAATRAVEEFTRLRRRILLPQAQLLLAETALMDGDHTAAATAAAAAYRVFKAQERTEWVALARYTSLRSRLGEGDATGRTVRGLIRSAVELDAAGWAVPAMDARLAAARLLLRTGDATHAEELLRDAAAPRRHGPAELRARAWHAEALRRLAAGRPRSAATALRAGIAVLEDHQATLAAADLRSTVSTHRTDLVELGTGLALDAGRARQVLQWAERGRATALRMQPPRPPDDPVLAQLLVELRAAVAETDAARAQGGPPDGSPARDAPVIRQANLERAIRDHVRATPGTTSAPRRPPIAEISAALGDAALVEYVVHGSNLHAVTIAGSRVRLTPLGAAAEVTPLLQQIPFALRRLARRSPRRSDSDSASAAMMLLERACRRLDRFLLAPLSEQIADRPLVIVPTGGLQSVPWSALPLCAARPVTVVPSAALWYRAQRTSPRPGPVVVAAGPDLLAAQTEAVAVAKLYPDVRVLVGRDATVAAVKSALADGSIVHIAAHGRLRADNPLFSSLRMVDGPLTVYDLETLARAPRLVVLAACDGGTSHTLAGDEILGLAAGFLAHGTTALVGPLGLVRDGAMEDLMVELHSELSSGVPPAQALAAVRRTVRRDSPALRAAAMSLVCLGAGHRQVLREPASPSTPS